MVRLVAVGGVVLLLVLAALSPLWLRLGGGAVVPIALAVLHALAMTGLAQWSLGDLRRDAFVPASPHPADYVTMTRSVIASGCLALVVVALADDLTLPSWWLAGVAFPALVLDAVDGPVARRTGTASPAGGRYDMEADSVFVLILALGATMIYGPWVMVIGTMRYAFVLAAVLVPRLRRPLAFNPVRRVIAAIQATVLVVSVSPLLPYRVNVILLVLVLASLLYSFGRDVITLLRDPAPQPAP